MTIPWIDQEQTSFGDYTISVAFTPWQSFTPSRNSLLVALDLALLVSADDSTVGLRIYDGEGVSGTLLHQETITLPYATTEATAGYLEHIELSSPVPTTGGQLYTICLFKTSHDHYWRYCTVPSDPYPDGDSSVGSGYDFAFRTYINYGAIAYAIVSKAQSGSLTAGAYLYRVVSGSLTAGAVVDGGVQPGGFSGLLQLTGVWPATRAPAVSSGSLTAGAIIQTTGSGWLYGQAIVAKTGAGSLAASAWLYKVNTGGITASALISRAWGGALTASAVIDRILYITASAYIVGPPAADRGQTMKLLYGNDKRNPRRVLNLADTDLTGKVFLREGGFTPEYGEQSILWSGQSLYTEGEDRIAGGVGNTSLSINYDLNGGSMTELGQLQRKINRFVNEIRMRHEKGEPVEKVWLEYRWADRLASLPAPFFGQLSHYYEVLNISPKMPGDMHSGALVAGQIESCVLELICSPYPEGLPQQAGNAVGHVLEAEMGVLVGGASAANQIGNGNFGHPTDWDYGWTRTDTTYVQLIEETGFWRSAGRAARIINAHGSATHGISHTVSGGYSYFFGFCCRRPDGEEVTVADVLAGGIVQIPGSDWYYCYTAGGSTIPTTEIIIAVQPGREIIVDNVFFLNSTHTGPFFSGDMHSASWSGTAFESSVTLAGGGIEYPTETEFCGTFTLEGWVVPDTYLYHSYDGYVWQYYVDASNYIRLYFSSYQITLERRFAGVSVSGTYSPDATPPYTPAHLAVVQDHGSLGLFINGEQQINLSVGPGMPANGTLAIGCSGISGGTAADSVGSLIFDGWRGFSVPLTATQINTLYDNELPIKQSGGKIGAMPFFWTKDGDGELDNYCDGDTHENWGIIGGVVGDLAAQVEWRLTPSGLYSSAGAYWLGRKSVEINAPEVFVPYGTVHFDRTGTAQSGTTGGEYNDLDCTTTYDETDMLETVAQPRFLRGRWRWMVKVMFYTQGGYLRPVWRVGTADLRTGGELAIANTTGLYTLDIESGGNWDMLIDWATALGNNPARVDVGFQRKGEDATADVWTDWYQLLPYPCCYVTSGSTTIDITSGDTLVISGAEAYQEATAGYPLIELEHQGDAVTVQPDFSNYIFIVSDSDDIDDTVTLLPIITPRWLVAGGPAA